jgi:hypothetical protein
MQWQRRRVDGGDAIQPPALRMRLGQQLPIREQHADQVVGERLGHGLGDDQVVRQADRRDRSLEPVRGHRDGSFGVELAVLLAHPGHEATEVKQAYRHRAGERFDGPGWNPAAEEERVHVPGCEGRGGIIQAQPACPDVGVDVQAGHAKQA